MNRTNLHGSAPTLALSMRRGRRPATMNRKVDCEVVTHQPHDLDIWTHQSSPNLLACPPWSPRDAQALYKEHLSHVQEDDETAPTPRDDGFEVCRYR
jgi:hypothetical protein